jgi:NitT/TauT family transport system substrate-binding protein
VRNAIGRLTVGLLILAAGMPTTGIAQTLTKVRVVLNFVADGGTGGFYYALERAYYRELGLDVTLEPSKGSADAITRTAAGAADIGIGDISTLVEFASRKPEVAPKAVFILHDRSPQAVITLKASGIAKLTDLHGRILGQGPADAPSRMFPAVARLAGLDMGRIELRTFSPQLRDTMLVTKRVDAVTGFDSTVIFNLKGNGIRAEDVGIIYYADNGLDVYGNAILVNREFLRANPDVVRRFVAASARGWREGLVDPKTAIQALGKHNNLANLEIEAERMEWIGKYVVTQTTRREGIGVADRARLTANVEQVTKAFDLPQMPALDDIYDGRFLSPREERLPLK